MTETVEKEIFLPYSHVLKENVYRGARNIFHTRNSIIILRRKSYNFVLFKKSNILFCFRTNIKILEERGYEQENEKDLFYC